MARFVALLRGINVGRNNRVAMADLRQILTGLGYTDVRTHLQSGNAVFTAPGRASTVERAVERELTDRTGLAIRVFVRSRDDLAAVIADNPLPATDPSRLLVSFLDRAPRAADLGGIGPDDYAPERYALGRREVYLWLPGGITGSKLVKALTDQRVGAEATSRNWNTVTRLLALADGQ